MNKSKDKFITGQRITLGLILFILCAACFVQTSMLGCSGGNGTGDGLESESRSSGTPFFSRSGNGDANTPDDWESVSDKVIGQIMHMYEDSGIDIEGIEKSEKGATAIRCFLASRDGVPVEKQFLDGLHILASTYPNLQLYFVRINGDEGNRIEIDQDTLLFLDEHGYTLESSPADAESLLHLMMQNRETEEELPDDSAEMIQIENSSS